MKISLVLFRRNLLPNGNIFRGKDRMVKPVIPRHMRQMKNRLDKEEQNMFLLRFPYLSEEESFGHARALGKPEKLKAELREMNNRMFKKQDVTLFERLLHLRVSESWE